MEEAIAQSLLAVVSSQPGITLAELLNRSTGAKSDDIYTLIVQERIYFDLNATPLAEPERCLIFRDEQTASAYRLMVVLVLDILLKICYRLEISLLDLLKPEQLAAKSFTKISHKTIRRSPTLRASPKLFEANQVQDALLAILASDNEPPLTMKEVATLLGYNRRTVFRHFPDLCRAISSKYRSYGKACHTENIQQSCREVKQIVLKLHHQGEYPSEARVSEIMAHPGYLRYKQVRAALNETRREIGV